MNELELYIPRLEELWFYRNMLSDPATMAYNAPWFPPEGCIPFPEQQWADWHEKWIGQEPERFYAYLRRKADGVFVGDVNFHHCPEKGWWDMGVLICAPERGKGYGKQGLRLLLDRAFQVAGITKLHNEFETTREAAYRIHRDAGFRETGVEDDIVQLELTREEYLSKAPLPDKRDISYISGSEKFNYRVCAIIVHQGKLLAMHDERSPYYYLPGGRVRLGETAEAAVLREVEEELGVRARLVRPLWLNQGFFTEDVDGLRYHELCLYFLVDVSGTGLPERGERFTMYEGKHVHDFEWLAFERLKNEYFYPVFLKTEIFHLPEQFTLRTEYE